MNICWLCLKPDQDGTKISRFNESSLCAPCDKIVHDELEKLGAKVELQDKVWCDWKKDLAAHQ